MTKKRAFKIITNRLNTADLGKALAKKKAKTPRVRYFILSRDCNGWYKLWPHKTSLHLVTDKGRKAWVTGSYEPGEIAGVWNDCILKKLGLPLKSGTKRRVKIIYAAKGGCKWTWAPKESG